MLARTGTKRAITISRLLSRIPSLVYGIIYLSLIPIFASLYNNLGPNNFYQSTLKQEQILDGVNENLREKLKEQIISTFVNTHGEDYKYVDNWTIRLDGFEIDSLEMIGDKIKFSFSLPLYESRYATVETHELPPLFSAEATISLTYIPITGSEDDMFYGAYNKVLSVKELNDPSLFDSASKRDLVLRAIFPYDAEPESSRLIFPLDRDVFERIKKYGDGLNGFLSPELDGNYGRMLYLSAVTITTLGYGDIVPLTEDARRLITIESILGIIIIGLFLNSLVNERKEGSQFEAYEKSLESGIDTSSLD